MPDFPPPPRTLPPFVPAVLRHFREASPGVQVELDEAGTAELVEAVLLGRLDAAFVRSAIGAVTGMRVEALLEEPMVAALPEGHRLAVGEEVPIPFTALAAEPFVLYRRRSGPGLYDAILAGCHEAGFVPMIVQEAPRLPATLSLVAAGLGISIVPSSMQYLRVAGIVFRDLGPPCLSAPIHLILRRVGPTATATRFTAAAKSLAFVQGVGPKHNGEEVEASRRVVRRRRGGT
ncbi:LysR substrate-binding domain-containing protein [Muricoccus vinaceus]|uniref:LysR substrate-binding domain-containing protein n=1 Tax=Muricoccus vinaceus TaxID=424704 RepID=A0ABV6J119_9PROT